MISIAKSDGELDRKPSSIEETRAEEKPRFSVIELDSKAPKSETIYRVVGRNVLAEDDKAIIGVGEESDADREIEEESRVFEVRIEKSPSFVQFDLRNDRFSARRDDFDANNQVLHAGGDAKVEVYKTLLSEFDDFVANEKHGAMEGASRALSYGFEVGDLVWGKVKSHPWWPGHIFNEAFASSSVRRTRREGYVLVAFFGDSSYGWFDPAELIPLVPHFAEKSQQTSSRNFVKAVEEAMDEACRRQGLGLACRCRNRFNFRPTDVQGYFEVDVPDYEPRGVYSENQIRKAWDAFQPGETLTFVKQMAFAPHECNQSTIEFFKNKATVFALRKAMFEEFDETYAQAFGVHSKRSANDPAKVSMQPVKQPARAPLSGPLVIAEALGGGKSSKKPVKVKDQSKKDRYLIKRRDEPDDLKSLQNSQKQASSSDPATPEEGSSAVITGNFVLQKRTPTSASGQYEVTGAISSEVTGSSADAFGKAVISDKGSINAESMPGTISSGIESANKENNAVAQKGNKLGSDVIVGPTSMSVSDIFSKEMSLGVADIALPSLQKEIDAVVDARIEYSAKVSESIEGSQLIENLPARSEGEAGSGRLQDANHGSYSSTPVGMAADVGVKKVEVHKQPFVDLTSENSIVREKKKKKKRRLDAEANPDQPKKRLAIRTGVAVAGKSTPISEATRGLQVHRKDSSSSDVSLISATVGPENGDLEVPYLLSTLHGLALDPFYGLERNGPPVTMQFFLRFRSFYYQKSPYYQRNVVSSPPSESESIEIRAKSSSVAVAENSAAETPSKPTKSLPRNDDPAKIGPKRLPSDRQEEIAAKRLKKIIHVKSLAAEKKVGQRMEIQRAEMKESAAAPPKLVKSNVVRKVAPQTRTIEPTMLIMKFPPQTSLPSAAELKAKFARFGAIDQSGIRVFWATSTCRVLFRYKVDALAAHKYAIANNSLFNDLSVRYSIREVGAPASSEAAESDKGRGDDTNLESARVKDPTIERQAVMHQPLPQSAIQPKSILKKPAGEEPGQVTGTNGGRGTARVKFMLGGEEPVRGEQPMVGNRNFNNNASFADAGAHTSVAMDINSKNFQKVIPPTSSSAPLLPLPPQFVKIPINNSHHTRTHTEVAPGNMHKNNSAPVTTSQSAPSIDISQQMLSLLMRCNDVVTSVSGLLGYVPYRPL